MLSLFSIKYSAEENIVLMKQIKQEVERLQKTYNSIRAKIILETEPNTNIEDSKGNTIAALNLKTKTVFDSKLFGTHHPRLYKKFSNEIEFPILRIK